MRLQRIRSFFVLGTVVTVATIASLSTSLVAQQNQNTGAIPAGYKAARTATGQPDLNGFWQALNTANWDIEEHGALPAPHQNLLGAYLAQPPGFGVVEGGAIPYKPEALEMKKKRFASRLTHNPMHYGGALGDEEDLSDPEAKCFLAGGLVRGQYMPYPMQIIQGRDTIVMAYQFASGFRVIHMTNATDSASLEKHINAKTLENDSWLGRSAGGWDGDTLVVRTVGPTYRSTTLDRAGNFTSNKVKVTERFTPSGVNHINYEATIDDPTVFTRPWKISLPIYRRLEPDAQLMEFRCQEMAEETALGHLRKRQLVRRWDGRTMRIDIIRKVPAGDAAYERHVDGNP